MNARVVAVGFSWVFVALAGCSDKGADDDEDTGRDIEVDDDYFDPVTAEGRVGETFAFENEGQRDHTVTLHRPPDPATQYRVDTTLRPGEDTTVTFDQPGTYHFFCRFHGAIGTGMHMNVTVAA